MTKLKVLTAAVAVILVFTGCQTIVSISQSDFKVQNGKLIKAYSSDLGYFNLNTPELSVQEQLAKKCPAGTATGVETKLLKRDYIIVQDYELFASASCQDDHPFKEIDKKQ